VARAASIALSFFLASAIFVFVVCVGLYVVSAPFAVKRVAYATQDRAGGEPASDERIDLASLTTRYVRTGSHATDLIEYYYRDLMAGSDSVGHLTDVHHVFRWVWVVWTACAVLVVGVVTGAVVRRKWRWLSRTLYSTACAGVVTPVALGVIGLIAFGPFFTLFHEIMFPQGNWEFPADSLLIQTFPEPFWIASMGLLLACVATGSLLVGLAGFLIRRASDTAAPVTAHTTDI
jgi:integral membrane protein (TIGR01906 family)